MGEEGFSSDSSLLYHRGVPSAVVDSQVWELPDQVRVPNHPLKPRHLRLGELATGTCAVRDRRQVLGNNDVRIGYVVTGTEASPYYRNSIGDECVFVWKGSGTVETVFGVVPYRAGDYVVVPRATTHRWVPAEPSSLYAIEANSHIAPPRVPVAVRTAPRARPVLRARPARPDRAAPRRRDRRRGPGQAPRLPSFWRYLRHPVRRAHPSLRRRRGTATSTPTRSTSPTSSPSPARSTSRRSHGLRELELRHLQLPAPQGRLPPAQCRCPTTTPTSTATRSCSTSGATTRRARAPASGSAPFAPPGRARAAGSPRRSRPRWAWTTSRSPR